MKWKTTKSILSTILLFTCLALVSKAEPPSVVIDTPIEWTLPDPFEARTVGRMPYPARSLYDFGLEFVDTCYSSVRLADVIQSAMDFSDRHDWEWAPIGIGRYGDDEILYCHVFSPYWSAVYAYLNPNQQGFPPSLMIIGGCANDPWPLVWFEMKGNAITLYSGGWDNNSDMRIECIEKYVIENGQFKLISVQHTSEKFDTARDFSYFELLLKHYKSYE